MIEEWIVNLINNCAFPIVMCVCMFKYMTTQAKETNDSVNKLCSKIDLLLDRDNKTE